MGAIQSALTEIETVVAGVSGIQQAQSNPSETQNTALFAVIYVPKDNIAVAPIGTRRSLFTVNIDVLKTRTWLPNDMLALLPLLDTIPAALVGQVAQNGGLFGATIQTFGRVDVTFLPKVEYADVPYIGYRFAMVDTKILVNL